MRKWHHYDPALKHMVTKIESGERWSLTAFTAADGTKRRRAAAGADLPEEDDELDDAESDHEIPWVVRDGFVAPEETPAAAQEEEVP